MCWNTGSIILSQYYSCDLGILECSRRNAAVGKTTGRGKVEEDSSRFTFSVSKFSSPNLSSEPPG